jgi:hypothetical protein
MEWTIRGIEGDRLEGGQLVSLDTGSKVPLPVAEYRGPRLLPRWVRVPPVSYDCAPSGEEHARSHAWPGQPPGRGPQADDNAAGEDWSPEMLSSLRTSSTSNCVEVKVGCC